MGSTKWHRGVLEAQANPDHYLRCQVHPRVDAHTFAFGLQGHGLGKVEAVAVISRKTKTPVEEKRGRLEMGQRWEAQRTRVVQRTKSGQVRMLLTVEMKL